MPRKNRPFQNLLLERLADPEISHHYLNEAFEESPESFLKALEAVAQARKMAGIQSTDELIQSGPPVPALNTSSTSGGTNHHVSLLSPLGQQGEAPVTVLSGGDYWHPKNNFSLCK
jgi:hypothetical protein